MTIIKSCVGQYFGEGAVRTGSEGESGLDDGRGGSAYSIHGGNYRRDQAHCERNFGGCLCANVDSIRSRGMGRRGRGRTDDLHVASYASRLDRDLHPGSIRPYSSS